MFITMEAITMAVTVMDPDAVLRFADRFGKISENFKRVSKVLQAAIMALRSSAFTGAFGNAALAQYLSGIKPTIDRLAATCSEFDTDLRAAVAAHREADEAAEARF
jgi:hypothetical protein